ncbi:MAG: UDP-N-acetylglucosamine 1-carboxyvinyltransferase [Oscillospiraceae bacterium]|nr:UDP-N-acetylglucosamine 1-carboxyvinyltransferase [Oscillospiraceae bacterium]
MEKIVISGGKKLCGKIDVSGAKNAALAIIPGAILAQDVCRIENIPNISDVAMMLKILSHIGAKVRAINEHTVEIDSTNIISHTVSHDLTKYFRASYYMIGALLGRFSKARVAMPGGCDFGGVRPIDQHIKGFELLGASIFLDEDAIVDASADSLTGTNVYLDTVSVGATVNIMLASVKAKGMTVIENAAKEPHVVDLANFLNSMGADVRGAGTDVIKIRGADSLHGCTYSIIPDQIEAGTYMVAVAAAGGDVLINNVIPKHLDSITAKLVECGIEIDEFDESVLVRSFGRPTKCNIKTMPHPGFPTDMQPQMAVLLSLASGTSIINEGVWDSRFRYVEQLSRMGVSIKVDGKLAVIEGVDHLKGAPVKADDLRAGAAMVIAGLAARGTTEIENVIYIDRGYEDIVEKLRSVGADISRVTVPGMEFAVAN